MEKVSDKELSKPNIVLDVCKAECINLLNLSAADDDLYDVLREIIVLEGKWPNVLAGLGLPHSQRSTIKMEHSTDASSCLQAVLVVWLSKNYNVEKHGPPSWQTLVKAVADSIGGADVALAKKIAEKHPGKVYTCICNMYGVSFITVSTAAVPKRSCNSSAQSDLKQHSGKVCV